MAGDIQVGKLSAKITLATDEFKRGMAEVMQGFGQMQSEIGGLVKETTALVQEQNKFFKEATKAFAEYGKGAKAAASEAAAAKKQGANEAREAERKAASDARAEAKEAAAQAKVDAKTKAAEAKQAIADARAAERKAAADARAEVKAAAEQAKSDAKARVAEARKAVADVRAAERKAAEDRKQEAQSQAQYEREILARASDSRRRGLASDRREYRQYVAEQVQGQKEIAASARAAAKAVDDELRKGGANLRSMIPASGGGDDGGLGSIFKWAVGLNQALSLMGKALDFALAPLKLLWSLALDFGSSLLDTSKRMEDFRFRLSAVFQSAQAGREAFNWLIEFATTVPKTIDEVMQAATTIAPILKGNMDELKTYMPFITDLSVVTGMTMQEVAGNFVKFASAGAAAADLWRERGVLAMLGFIPKQAYTAEESMKKLNEAIRDHKLFFDGIAKGYSSTWDGLVSMMQDKWTRFKLAIMDAGPFDVLKGALRSLQEYIDRSWGSIENFATALGRKLKNAIIDLLPYLRTAVGWLSRFVMTTDTWKKLEEIVSETDSQKVQENQGFFGKVGSVLSRIGNPEVGVDAKGNPDPITKMANGEGKVQRVLKIFDELAAGLETSMLKNDKEMQLVHWKMIFPSEGATAAAAFKDVDGDIKSLRAKNAKGNLQGAAAVDAQIANQRQEWIANGILPKNYDPKKIESAYAEIQKIGQTAMAQAEKLVAEYEKTPETDKEALQKNLDQQNQIRTDALKKSNEVAKAAGVSEVNKVLEVMHAEESLGGLRKELMTEEENRIAKRDAKQAASDAKKAENFEHEIRRKMQLADAEESSANMSEWNQKRLKIEAQAQNLLDEAIQKKAGHMKDEIQVWADAKKAAVDAQEAMHVIAEKVNKALEDQRKLIAEIQQKASQFIPALKAAQDRNKDELLKVGGETDYERERRHINDKADQDIASNPQFANAINQARELELHTAGLNAGFSQFDSTLKQFGMTGETIQGVFSAIGDSLATLFDQMAQGKFAFGDFVYGFARALQQIAATRTATLLMEGVYNSIMGMIYQARAAGEATNPLTAFQGMQDQIAAAGFFAAATQAYTGAAVMGSFVAGSMAGSMIGKGVKGKAHSGIDSVPFEGDSTWLLKKGERVVQPEANKDLTSFLDSQGQGARPSVTMNVEINGGDEKGVLAALPKLREMVVETVTGDIASNGTIYKAIKNFA